MFRDGGSGHWSDDAVPVARPGVVTEFLDAEALLLDEQTGLLLRLDRPGAAVWAWCDGTTSLGGIILAIAEATGTSIEVVAEDTRALLDRLAAAGVIEQAAPSPSPEDAGGMP